MVVPHLCSFPMDPNHLLRFGTTGPFHHLPSSHPQEPYQFACLASALRVKEPFCSTVTSHVGAVFGIAVQQNDRAGTPSATGSCDLWGGAGGSGSARGWEVGLSSQSACHKSKLPKAPDLRTGRNGQQPESTRSNF